LQLEGSIGAADFGIGERGQRVERSRDGDGAQEFLAMQLGVAELADDRVGAWALKDVEDGRDGELQRAGDLLDGEGFGQVVVEDEIGGRWKGGGLRFEGLLHGAAPWACAGEARAPLWRGGEPGLCAR
jgi:hypothetical protein